MAGASHESRSIAILDSWDVTVHAGAVSLDGTLAIPASDSGLVAFAHGSGDSRFTPRNRNIKQPVRVPFLVNRRTALEKHVEKGCQSAALVLFDHARNLRGRHPAEMLAQQAVVAGMGIVDSR